MRRAAALIAGLCALATGPAIGKDYADAPGARLRVLDKLTAQVQDITVSRGQAAEFGRLLVQVDDCRYPADNRTAEAFAHLTILQRDIADPVFRGWMVASSPALSALDNPRYDVWVIRCDVPDLDLPEVQAPTEGEGASQGETTTSGDGG